MSVDFPFFTASITLPADFPISAHGTPGFPDRAPFVGGG
jgi:hypothetical protein